MINISWDHEAAKAPAFASLLPKALESIGRWGYPVGNMEMDEYGPFYRVKLSEELNTKAPVGPDASWLLRPATLRLGAMKALQEAPSHWAGWADEITQIFENVGGVVMHGTPVHQPVEWSNETLDLMVQLAWFREVWFA